MAVYYNRQYIGARYVPKFFENPDGSWDWAPGFQYEPLTIVKYGENTYISKKLVPDTISSPNTNLDYWANTGSYNGFIDSIYKRIEYLPLYCDIFNNIQSPGIWHTNGFYKIGDKGMGMYIVSKDNMEYSIPINGLYALPIGHINPFVYGAMGDGVANDTVAVQTCINYSEIADVDFAGKFAVTNLSINKVVHCDFKGCLLIGIGISGIMLDIDIPAIYNQEDPMYMKTDISNIHLFTKVQTYSWTLSVSARSLRINSIIIETLSNGMKNANRDGMSFDFIRISSMSATEKVPSPAIGLQINREDVDFNYVDISDFSVCVQININRSFSINDMHLWSEGNTGIEYTLGFGGHIGNYIADSLQTGILLSGTNYGFDCSIDKLLCENVITLFQVPYTQSLSFLTVCSLAGNFDNLCNSPSNNGSIHILSGDNYKYGFQDSLEFAPDQYYQGWVKQGCYHISFAINNPTTEQLSNGFGFFKKVGNLGRPNILNVGSCLFENENSQVLGTVRYGVLGLQALYPEMIGNVTRIRFNIVLPYGHLNV